MKRLSHQVLRPLRSGTVKTLTTWSTASTSLYGWGHGVNGALGTGGTKSMHKPAIIPYFKKHGLQVQSIAAGWGHSAAVSRDGTLYLFGRTHDLKNCLRVTRFYENWPKLTRLFALASSIDYMEPTPMNIPEPVTTCVASAALTAALTESGKVYCIGANHFGQCGNGTIDATWEPTLVQGLEGKVVKKVSLGLQHAIALCEGGSVYTWGKGAWGQLALGDVEESNDEEILMSTHAREVTFFKTLDGSKVVDVSAGFNHSVMLTDDGKVWVCGKYQSLLLEDEGGKNYAHSRIPRQVDFSSVLPKNVDITRVECGQQFTVALASDHTVWQWGMLPDGLGQSGSDRFGVQYSKHRMLHTPIQVGKSLRKGESFRVDPSTKFVPSHDQTRIVQDGRVMEWDWDLEPRVVEELDGDELGGAVVDIASGWKHDLILVLDVDPNTPDLAVGFQVFVDEDN